MTKCFSKILFIILVSITIGHSQISPGDLSQAHSEYEGLSNCTLCHDLGKKVSNAKCLDCHKDIQSLISNKRGYHFNEEVKNKDCFDCHSDHHGRKFDMVRFDEKNFDHKLAGYALKKKHARIECRDCHKPDYIKDDEIKKRKDTYLGLDDACLTCHEDFHQKTLSNDCAKCHDEEEFRPAPNFNHSDSKYKLEGKHQDVECKKCHKIEKRNGKDFQYFTDLAFNDCKSCHDDPHLNHLPGKCSQCHSVNTFQKFIGQKTFNHNSTGYKLKGKHKRISCYKCHNKTSNPKRTFQDRNNIKANACNSCHEDKHEGKFGLNCAKCHTESSFLKLKNMDFFDHSVTHFKLEGKHIDVDCKKCHKGRFTDPLDYNQCKNCHEDYHNGEFIVNKESPDCIECHSLNEGFEYSLYDFEQHQKSKFPLNGAHVATPCFACHVSEDRWTFRKIGESCVDCHDDIHEKFIDKKYYPEQTCNSCHIEDDWSTINFDHDSTDWKLEGKHTTIKCRECHFIQEKQESTYIQKFESLDNGCINCHDNIHDEQFAIDGITDCVRCHDSKDWVPRNFDHNTTAFPLDGKHSELDCFECHKPLEDSDNNKINYKIEKFECVDCHG